MVKRPIVNSLSLVDHQGLYGHYRLCHFRESGPRQSVQGEGWAGPSKKPIGPEQQPATDIRLPTPGLAGEVRSMGEGRLGSAVGGSGMGTRGQGRAQLSSSRAPWPRAELWAGEPAAGLPGSPVGCVQGSRGPLRGSPSPLLSWNVPEVGLKCSEKQPVFGHQTGLSLGPSCRQQWLGESAAHIWRPWGSRAPSLCWGRGGPRTSLQIGGPPPPTWTEAPGFPSVDDRDRPATSAGGVAGSPRDREPRARQQRLWAPRLFMSPSPFSAALGLAGVESSAVVTITGDPVRTVCGPIMSGGSSSPSGRTCVPELAGPGVPGGGLGPRQVEWEERGDLLSSWPRGCRSVPGRGSKLLQHQASRRASRACTSA